MSTVLITGAASGIGRAAAHRFAAAGWQCVLVDRNAQALAEMLRTLAPSTPAHLPVVLDLTDVDAIARVADGVPPLDALINNAGMSDSRGVGLSEQTPADQAALVALNLHAPAALVQALSPRLGPGARIVNVASGAGLRAIPWRGMYSPTKAGVIAQTRALAAARPDWRVTVLCPGFVRTELVDGLIAAGRLDPAAAVARIPLGRMAEPAEMAEALLFLAGPDAAPLHGAVVSLDGGSSVFAGGVRCEPARVLTTDMNAAVDLRVVGEGAWQAMAQPVPGGYAAVIDTSALQAAEPWQAVHEAAARFARTQEGPASLTLLLPQVATDADWQAAGELATARMLVATLACEWSARGWRINALEIPANTPPVALVPLLHYVAGTRAQFLTGQVLPVHPHGGGRHG